jgi:tol-pal system protein YbgF
LHTGNSPNHFIDAAVEPQFLPDFMSDSGQSHINRIFMMFKRTVFAACLLAGVAVSALSPARAEDIATRIFNIENQIRQLTGQLEELNHSIRQLQQQVANGGAANGSGATQQQGDLQPAPVVSDKPKMNLKKLAAAEPDTMGEQTQAEAAIGETNSTGAGTESIVDGTQLAAPPKKVATISGILNEDGAQVDGAQPAVADGTQQPADGIEQVSLTPATDTPEALYEKNYEALLRRQFGNAETGFRDFLVKYPQHSLSGSAQFQLGETFYAQGKYEEAARNYLQGYKTYPKSRRAPDSLMKLGLSLGKLGQKEQACNALASVSTDFPRAIEVKKRADAEYKRGGC